MPHVLPAGVLLLVAREPAPPGESELEICHVGKSRSAGDEAYAQIFPDCYELFGQLAEEWDGDRDLVPVSTMGLMLVDWLDPFKVV